MRYESWLIGAALITLTLSAFIGFYMLGADSDHYAVDIPSDFEDSYDAYKLDSNTAKENADNYSGWVIEVTNDSKNAETVETDYGADLTKSQLNPLKKMWSVVKDTGNRFLGLTDQLSTVKKLLNIPDIIISTLLVIVAILLLFAFLHAVFGRQV